MKTATLTVEPQTGEPSSERDIPSIERREWGFVGLAIAALIPALVWTLIIAGAVAFFGGSVSTTALSIIGAVIAFVLALICAPLMLQQS